MMTMMTVTVLQALTLAYYTDLAFSQFDWLYFTLSVLRSALVECCEILTHEGFIYLHAI